MSTKPLIVYIAGPYRDRTGWRVEQNIRRAEEVAYRVWGAGHVALCPHTNSRFPHSDVPDSHWLAGTMELMLRCDAVIALPGWRQSAGTVGEVEAADEAGIPVEFLPYLSRFSIQHALDLLVRACAETATIEGTMT